MPESGWRGGLGSCLNDSSSISIFHGLNYRYIPETCLYSFLAWLVLMAGFLLFRKNAFNFMSSRIYQNLLECSDVLFRRKTDQDAEAPVDENLDPDMWVDTDEEGEGRSNVENPLTDAATCERREIRKARREELERRTRVSRVTEGFSGWIKNNFECLFYSDATMLRLAGKDAVNYLRLQQYIIIYHVLLMIVAICIILPINLQGNLYSRKDPSISPDYGSTTIDNLDANSMYLYAHTMLSFLLFPTSVYWMRKFSKNIGFKDVDLVLTRTVIIENIPLSMSKTKFIKHYFSEAYPSLTVTDIQMAYNVEELTKKNNELQNARDSRELGEKHQMENQGESLTMYPIDCSRFCGFCCCCSEKVDVVEFYKEEEDRLEREVARLREESLNSPMGIAFVSFDNINSSKAFHDHHERCFNFFNFFNLRPKPKRTSLSDSLKPKMWKISFAPHSRDVIWTALKRSKLSLCKKIVINVGLFLVGVFATTPQFIAHNISRIFLQVYEKNIDVPDWIRSFVPIILLNIFTVLMPALIAYSVRLMGYWYTSTVNYKVFVYTFWYLWTVVIIFPTLGLTTINALISNIILKQTSGTGSDINWECFFNPDTSAFYVNYIIFAALVGTATELLTMGYLFYSRTPANSRAVQRYSTYEFLYGDNYARMLMMHAITSMYSFSSPLVTPFGLLYFVMKHLVDKHNLTWVYSPSEVNIKIHGLAIKLIIFNVVMQQIFLTVVYSLRNLDDSVNWSGLGLSVALLSLTLVIFLNQAFPGCFKKMSPIRYSDVIFPDEKSEDSNKKYLPDVLLEAGCEDQEDKREAGGEDQEENRGYGTFTDDLVQVRNQN